MVDVAAFHIVFFTRYHYYCSTQGTMLLPGLKNCYLDSISYCIHLTQGKWPGICSLLKIIPLLFLYNEVDIE